MDSKMLNKATICSLPVGGADTSLHSQGAPRCHAPKRKRNLPGRQTPRPPATTEHTQRGVFISNTMRYKKRWFIGLYVLICGLQIQYHIYSFQSSVIPPMSLVLLVRGQRNTFRAVGFIFCIKSLKTFWLNA